ncbi:MAG: putative flavoprotein [Roseibaca calidilacus]|uniref:NAD(P)H-dependent FMN reductase n=1 Tax=Roseibaca calidilacus TaxID=1666912 RepID=A0A0P7WK99_9RHOB|nr:NADPH-dependent FMN reductase [Roseibaca calidilacus]KPP94500.1 MAG: putative flavoprotein [Roseibaca calidilacus]CUX83132.1 NAD(P)H-dependent FMN reductase [Roseibaca calidilacus]
MSELTLMGLCGSLRADSFNRKLMHAAARSFGPAQFVEGDLNLPLFNEDVEAQGMPEAVTRLKEQVKAADAVVIACPEYNKAPPGVLKNALDWISRGGQPWTGKPVALVSAAGGRAGGERTQFALRLMMVPFRPLILQGPEVLVASPKDHFDTQGALITETYQKLLDELMASLRAAAEGRRA